MNNSNELLTKANEILEDEGSKVEVKTNQELLTQFVLPGLENSKATASSLYNYIPRDKSGFVGKLKNKVLLKLKNIVISVVEKQSMKQQKFNELTVKAIQALSEENETLKKQISKNSKQ